ncbi:hypothetical protein ACJX0J_026925, partial [Zea mays]
ATNIVCTIFTTNAGIILLFRKNKKVIIHMITPKKNMPTEETIQPIRKQAPHEQIVGNNKPENSERTGTAL